MIPYSRQEIDKKDIEGKKVLNQIYYKGSNQYFRKKFVIKLVQNIV